MTRHWLYYRVAASAPDPTAPVVAGLLPGLVARLHGTDPQGQWFFLRFTDGLGPHVRIRFLSTPAVNDAIEREITEASRAQKLFTVLDYYEPETAKYPGPVGVAQAEKVFHASSECVLILLDGAGTVTPRTLLPLVTRHLGQVAHMLPPEQRVSFLFHYWCYWTAGLGTAQRTALGERAVRSAAAVWATANTLSLPERARDPWQHYLSALRTTVTDQRGNGSAPINHLVFHHAHLMHNRLGAWPVMEALAARILHLQLVGRPPGSGRTDDDHGW
ncbi:thiopeptide-type bacteriocin biosynthesis protein [Streptomyces sp. bgisy084]|uniref:thiopeptide-type bacteriocin biosynthesis protein n=1 Tax=unclassified Streptomyces TaxID=2593676 RepID=UPI003D743191